jgi:hypothetical protein
VIEGQSGSNEPLPTPDAETLGEQTLVDLAEWAEDGDLDALDDYLAAALETVRTDALRAIGIELDDPPGVTYNSLRQGTSYDPRVNELVVRQPRDPPLPGHEHLRHDRPSLLAVLTTGLLTAANQRLAHQHFERDPIASKHVHDQESETLEPGIDAGFVAPVAFFLDATDPSLEAWEEFLAARREWYRDTGAVNARRFEAVARTVGDRVLEDDAPPHEALAEGLSIRESLIVDGDRSVIAGAGATA